jgi:hypothetical protein
MYSIMKSNSEMMLNIFVFAYLQGFLWLPEKDSNLH